MFVSLVIVLIKHCHFCWTLIVQNVIAIKTAKPKPQKHALQLQDFHNFYNLPSWTFQCEFLINNLFVDNNNNNRFDLVWSSHD